MLEEISTQRTRSIITGAEPFVQAGRVKFLFASLAAQFGQRVITAMNHRETDHAVLYSLKTLVHISLPQNEAIHYTSILKKDMKMVLNGIAEASADGMLSPNEFHQQKVYYQLR